MQVLGKGRRAKVLLVALLAVSLGSSPSGAAQAVGWNAVSRLAHWYNSQKTVVKLDESVVKGKGGLSVASPAAEQRGGPEDPGEFEKNMASHGLVPAPAGSSYGPRFIDESLLTQPGVSSNAHGAGDNQILDRRRGKPDWSAEYAKSLRDGEASGGKAQLYAQQEADRAQSELAARRVQGVPENSSNAHGAGGNAILDRRRGKSDWSAEYAKSLRDGEASGGKAQLYAQQEADLAESELAARRVQGGSENSSNAHGAGDNQILDRRRGKPDWSAEYAKSLRDGEASGGKAQLYAQKAQQEADLAQSELAAGGNHYGQAEGASPHGLNEQIDKIAGSPKVSQKFSKNSNYMPAIGRDGDQSGSGGAKAISESASEVSTTTRSLTPVGGSTGTAEGAQAPASEAKTFEESLDNFYNTFNYLNEEIAKRKELSKLYQERRPQSAEEGIAGKREGSNDSSSTLGRTKDGANANAKSTSPIQDPGVLTSNPAHGLPWAGNRRGESYRRRGGVTRYNVVDPAPDGGHAASQGAGSSFNEKYDKSKESELYNKYQEIVLKRAGAPPQGSTDESS